MNMIIGVSQSPQLPPRPSDENYAATREGFVNVLSDTLLQLFGVIPRDVREEAAAAAIEVVERFLHNTPPQTDTPANH